MNRISRAQVADIEKNLEQIKAGKPKIKKATKQLSISHKNATQRRKVRRLKREHRYATV